MESNVKRIEEALERLHEAAEAALKIAPQDDTLRGSLEVVSRLTPDAIESEMARHAHAELADFLANSAGDCGYVDLELVAVVNGLKELIEKIDGRWLYEDARWHYRKEYFARVRDVQAAEAAK